MSTTSVPYMQRQFGGPAEDIGAALVAAGLAAHERSMEAKAGSGLSTNEAYGATFWLALADEVVSRVRPLLPESELVQPYHSRYPMLVNDGVLIFAAKVMEGTATRADSMRLRPSELRRNIFTLSDYDSGQLSLIDELTDTPGDAAAQEARRALGSSAGSMMTAAYVCSSDGGLRAVYVGDAALDEDGYLLWSEREALPMGRLAEATPRPQPVTTETFESAPRPRPVLGLVGDEPTGTGAHASADDLPDSPITS